jgi:hypothetical protein
MGYREANPSQKLKLTNEREVNWRNIPISLTDPRLRRRDLAALIQAAP